MKILAIETSGKICAVALLEDKDIIQEKIIEDENTHSVKLMPLIDELLKETKVNLKDIDLFVCDKGPGSFTGIRIGISTIKAFIDVTNKKAIGITSLEALAYGVEEEGIICSLIDAKNENVYYGLFKKERNDIKQVGKLEFNNINEIINILGQIKEKIIFIGNGSLNYKELIKYKLNEEAVFVSEEKSKLNARNIALVAYEKKNEAVDSKGLVPVYLRKSSAERLLKNK